jgi:hypothetical protein
MRDHRLHGAELIEHVVAVEDLTDVCTHLGAERVGALRPERAGAMAVVRAMLRRWRSSVRRLPGVVRSCIATRSSVAEDLHGGAVGAHPEHLADQRPQRRVHGLAKDDITVPMQLGEVPGHELGASCWQRQEHGAFDVFKDLERTLTGGPVDALAAMSNVQRTSSR